MKRLIISTIAVLFLLPAMTYSQKVGIKTNMLYWATTTPNLGVEVALNEKYTLSLHAGWNPFTLSSKTHEDGSVVASKIRHLSIMPELKYWKSQTFERSYWGVHGIYGHYNMGGNSFLNPLKNHRYQGDAYGGGISYGYQWALSKNWGLEASLGVGYLHLDYKKYDKEKCGEYLGKFNKNYVGPTKVGVSFVYFLD